MKKEKKVIDLDKHRAQKRKRPIQKKKAQKPGQQVATILRRMLINWQKINDGKKCI